MAWIFLAAAIVCEVFGTTMMKVSEGFSRLWPSVGMVAGYLGAFGMMALALKRLPVGTLYALWAGIGTALIALVGVLAFGESFTVVKGAGIVLIIAGVILLNLTGAH